MSVATVTVQYGTQQSRFDLPSRDIPIGSLILDFFKSKGLDEYVELEDFAVRLLIGEVFFSQKQPVSDFLDCAWSFREEENDELSEILLIVRKSDVGDAAQRQAQRVDLNEPSLFSGYLWKKGGSPMTPYKKRWFCLQGATLYYQEDENSTNTLGFIPMGGCEVKYRPGTSNKNFSHAFELTAGTAGKRDYALGAESEEELARFTQAVDLFNFRRCKSIIVASLMELRRRGFATMDGIFRLSGEKSAVEAIKAAYDRTHFPKLDDVKDDNVLAGVVKMTLRDMRYPLVPFEKYQDFVNVGREMESERERAARDALRKLPFVNLVFLKYLCTVFNEIASFESTTKMTAKNLAIVLAPNVVRMESESAQTMTDANYILNCVEAMILNHETVFPPDIGSSSIIAPPPPPPPPKANHLSVGVNLFAGISKEVAGRASMLKPVTKEEPPATGAASPTEQVVPQPPLQVQQPPSPSSTQPIPPQPRAPPGAQRPSIMRPTPPPHPQPPGQQCDLNRTTRSSSIPSSISEVEVENEAEAEVQVSVTTPLLQTPEPIVTEEAKKVSDTTDSSCATSSSGPKSLPAVSQATLELASSACKSIYALLSVALSTHNTLAKDLSFMASTFSSLPNDKANEIASNVELQATLASILSQSKALTLALNNSSSVLNSQDAKGVKPSLVIGELKKDFESHAVVEPSSSSASPKPRLPLPTLPASLPPLPNLPNRPLPNHPAAVKVIGTATALYDYPGGSRPGDVAFVKDSRIYIESKEPTQDPNSAGWYKAYLKDPSAGDAGSTYWIPANYVKMN